MAKRIIHKLSTERGKKPTIHDIVEGEFAYNSCDAKIFAKQKEGNSERIVEFTSNSNSYFRERIIAGINNENKAFKTSKQYILGSLNVWVNGIKEVFFLNKITTPLCLKKHQVT